MAKGRRVKVLVLGANSFLGASFIAYLLGRGEHEVIATSRSEQASPTFLPYMWGSRRDVRFEKVDLNHDTGKLSDILKDVRPTHIANFAAQSMVAESWDTPEEWMQTNVVALTRVIDLLRQVMPPKSTKDYFGNVIETVWPFRFLHVTTPEVYGSLSGWANEDAEFNPSTPYAVSRAAGDMLLATYLTQYRFPVLFVRPSNIYGPGQRPYRIIA